jgi:hypothetical protein
VDPILKRRIPMKLRTVVGIAALGGLLVYAYRRRGGEFTVESFKQTARDLFGRAKTEARALKDRAEKLKDRAENRISHEVSNTAPRPNQPH